jgi:predicted Zn finger-like uncharacterized protein
MSGTGDGRDLMLRCPACERTFAVGVPQAPVKDLSVICGACRHRLSTDEILDAMAASLNDLLDQTRSRLTDKPTKS